jgi:hypothetical protein
MPRPQRPPPSPPRVRPGGPSAPGDVAHGPRPQGSCPPARCSDKAALRCHPRAPTRGSPSGPSMSAAAASASGPTRRVTFGPHRRSHPRLPGHVALGLRPEAPHPPAAADTGRPPCQPPPTSDIAARRDPRAPTPRVTLALRPDPFLRPPPARRPPIRGHGFARSHGPTEDIVNHRTVKVRLSAWWCPTCIYSYPEITYHSASACRRGAVFATPPKDPSHEQ